MLAQNHVDCRRLGAVIDRCRGAVGIDVVNLAGRQFSVGQCLTHRPGGTVNRRGDDVASVRRHPGANNFAQDRCAPRTGTLEFLEDQDSGTLAQHHAVAVFRERPAAIG